MSNWPLPGGGASVTALGSLSASSSGTTVAGGTTANTKNAWQQIIASTAKKYESIAVIAISESATNNIEYLFDIGIGAAGVEQVIVENLAVKAASSVLLKLTTHCILPVAIPAGSRVAVRSQHTGTTARSMQIVIYGCTGGFMTPIGCSKAVGYVDLTTSKGLAVNAGATINTEGAYTEFSSSTAFDYVGFLIGFGQNANANPALGDFLFDVSIGAAGVEQVIIPDLLVKNIVEDVCFPHYAGPFMVSVKKGSRLAVRCQSTVNDATDRILDVCLYGLVA